MPKAMIVDELATASRRGITLLSGEPIAEGLARATTERDTVPGAQAESVPRYSVLARELLAACGDTNPASTYSHLSGVAHGEAVFTSSLSDQPFGGQDSLSTVSLPTQNLASYSTSLVGVTIIGMAQLLREWGVAAEIDAAFSASLTRTSACLKSIPGLGQAF